MADLGDLLKQIGGDGKDLLALLRDASSDAAGSSSAGGQPGDGVEQDLMKKIHELINNQSSKNVGVPIPMIGEDGIFYEPQVEEFIKSSTRLLARGQSFAIISIIGAQSSGKSFLLNQLFGTKFEVMNARTGRKQTTKGVWLSRSIEPCALIMDVEGSDGRERGEDNVSFERQSALFALTVSDLMMVNLWLQDIGRQQGGGIPLLRTVFQERVKLDPGQTKVLVVIRNYDNETPIEELQNDVMATMKELWESVHNRPGRQTVRFSDYIEVIVVTLPDKREQHFEQEVKKLRDWFVQKTLVGLRQDKVSTSGFSLSAKMIWEAIQQNKQLDLPGNRVIVSAYFCEKIVKESIDSLVLHKDYLLLNEVASSDEFREKLDALLDCILTRYDMQTDMYEGKERAAKRDELEKGILQHVESFARNLSNRLRLDISCESKENIAADLSKADDPAKEVNALVEKFLESFTRSCEGFRSRYTNLYLESYNMLRKELTSYAKATALSIKEKRMREEIERAVAEAERAREEAEHAKQEAERARQEKIRAVEEAERARAEAERSAKYATEEVEARARIEQIMKEAQCAREEANLAAQRAVEQANQEAERTRAMINSKIKNLEVAREEAARARKKAESTRVEAECTTENLKKQAEAAVEEAKLQRSNFIGKFLSMLDSPLEKLIGGIFSYLHTLISVHTKNLEDRSKTK